MLVPPGELDEDGGGGGGGGGEDGGGDDGGGEDGGGEEGGGEDGGGDDGGGEGGEEEDGGGEDGEDESTGGDGGSQVCGSSHTSVQTTQRAISTFWLRMMSSTAGTRIAHAALEPNISSRLKLGPGSPAASAQTRFVVPTISTRRVPVATPYAISPKGALSNAVASSHVAAGERWTS